MSRESTPEPGAPRVLHSFRPLLGGVFRHVIDLARGQIDRGMQVGLVCDSTQGSQRAESELASLGEICQLGVHRLRINRRLHPSDLAVRRQITRLCRELRPDVLHGHGAKGGAFARLCHDSGARIVYTPHGGVLHYDPSSLGGRVYFAMERRMLARTHGLIFASQFGADTFAAKIAVPGIPTAVVHNGLHPAEFEPVDTSKATYDFVFAGEIRRLKGLEELLRATSAIATSQSISLLVCGSGPDEDHFRARTAALDLGGSVTFRGPVSPIARAFAEARAVVVPSLSESFPYIVLEAIAAGVPLIATRAGGIPEIYAEEADQLIPTGDWEGLARAMRRTLEDPPAAAARAEALRSRVAREFTVERMVNACTALYRRTEGPA